MDDILKRLENDWKLVRRYRSQDPDSYDRTGMIITLRRESGNSKMSDIEAWMTKVETLYQGMSAASTPDQHTAWMAEVRNLYEPDKPAYHQPQRSAAHARTKRRFHARWTGEYRVMGEIPHSHYTSGPKQASQTEGSSLEESLAEAKKAGNKTAIAELTHLIELRDHWYTRH